MDFRCPPLLPLQRQFIPLARCLKEVHRHPPCPISLAAFGTYPEPLAPLLRNANTINLPVGSSFISYCPKPAHHGVLHPNLRGELAFDVFWASKLKV